MPDPNAKHRSKGRTPSAFVIKLNMFLMVGRTVGNSTSSNFLKWIKSITVILRWMRGIKFITSKEVLITKLPKPADLVT